MKDGPWIPRALVVAGIVGFGMFPMAAAADDSEEVQELQRVIAAQQQQLESQQQQLERLRGSIESLTRLLQELQSRTVAEEEPSVAELRRLLDAQQQQLAELQQALDEQTRLLEELRSGAPSVPTQEPEGPGLLSQRDKHDLESPVGSNVTYFDAAAKAMIPGTRTEVGVHGLVEFQIIHDSVGLNNNRFDTALIPVDGGPAQTKFSVNPSQFAVSSMTPVEQARLNTWLSIDMNGELDRPEPRLRIAFAEYVNYSSGWAILGGQTYSTMLDLRAVPETLDFALPAGLWQLRQPLLRVSKSLTDTVTGEFSLETPENVRYIDAERKLTRWPDAVVAGTWQVGLRTIKHFRLAALGRDLIAEGTDGSTDSAVGWAVSGSTKLGLPFLGESDSLKLTVHYGDGYGTQLKGGPAEGIYVTATSSLETIGVFGAFGGLQHFWSDRFRSNLAFGYVDARNPAIATGDTLTSTAYLAADFIWSPFPTTTIGVEYLWGIREDENGESGTSNRILLSSMYRF